MSELGRTDRNAVVQKSEGARRGEIAAGKQTRSGDGGGENAGAQAGAAPPGSRGAAVRAGDWEVGAGLLAAMGLGPAPTSGDAGATGAVQRKAGGSATAAPAADGAFGPGGDVAQVAAEGVRGAGQTLPHQETIQRAFGPHDVSGVQAHVGGAAGRAADAIGAEAYATGSSVAFRESPSLFTAAHEAAHIVQQRAGVQLLGGVGVAGDLYEQHADAVATRVVAGQSAADLLPGPGGGGGASPSAAPANVQLRRVPANTGDLLTSPTDPTAPGANPAAHTGGASRVVALAESELDAPDLAAVHTTMLGGETPEELAALPEHERLTRHTDAIRAVRPELTLGDPSLIDTAPALGTVEAHNLWLLVNHAANLFDDITSGARDADLEQVFGLANVADVKHRYSLARAWMEHLYSGDAVLTDLSGYNEEVGIGGLTTFAASISLAPNLLAAPDDHESIATMIHESMHAGNADIGDHGYIGTQIFTQLPEDVKLRNAAHFEVVPRRILGAAHAYPGVIFTPAAAAPTPAAAPGAPAAAPTLTTTQRAVREASERIRMAWTMGLNLHTLYLEAYKNPGEWTAPRMGGSFEMGLPYWSKVEKLTIHEKTDLDPASMDLARLPVSTIDMALSEGVTRKLSQCMGVINSVPDDDAGAAAALAATASAAEITAATTETDQIDLWIAHALRTVGSITGTTARDLRVVEELVMLAGNWNTVLDRRALSTFRD